jgi:hypothetical protein
MPFLSDLVSQCLSILLRLTLLPLLVAVTAPISAMLRLGRFFFAQFDPSIDITADASAAAKLLAVVFGAAGSFEAEAIVRYYAAKGVAVMAIDRNVAVLAELYKHEARLVHCVAQDSAAQQLRDVVERTNRLCAVVVVVEPSGECTMRRLLERDAILGSKSDLLAALCDFCSVHAETNGAASSAAGAEGEGAAQSVSHSGSAHSFSSEIIETSLNPCRTVFAALSVLVPVMLRDSCSRSLRSAAAAASAKSSGLGFLLASIRSLVTRSAPGEPDRPRFFRPRLVYVSRDASAEPATFATCLAHILVAQQNLGGTSSAAQQHIKLLPGISHLRQSSMRSVMQAAAAEFSTSAAPVSFAEVSLYAAGAQVAARTQFELRMHEFSAGGLSQSKNRQKFRVPSVVHGRNAEILASSASHSPPSAAAAAAAASSGNGSASSSNAAAVDYTELVEALGAATATASEQRKTYCCCLQPSEGVESDTGRGNVASFVAPGWASSLTALWLTEERLVRELVGF